jgi:hypothetical protein
MGKRNRRAYRGSCSKVTTKDVLSILKVLMMNEAYEKNLKSDKWRVYIQ